MNTKECSQIFLIHVQYFSIVIPINYQRCRRNVVENEKSSYDNDVDGLVITNFVTCVYHSLFPTPIISTYPKKKAYI